MEPRRLLLEGGIRWAQASPSDEVVFEAPVGRKRSRLVLENRSALLAKFYDYPVIYIYSIRQATVRQNHFLTLD